MRRGENEAGEYMSVLDGSPPLEIRKRGSE